MQLSGLIKQTLLDYPGLIAATVFTQGCNFRCPICHNGHLLPVERGKIDCDSVLRYLEEAKGFIEGVCITGGEPTLHADLPEFLQKLKRMGYRVKLDTNGSNPEMLKQLFARGLVDFVAMDVKAPLETKKYCQAIGLPEIPEIVEAVKESIDLIAKSGVDHEFRLTYCPSLLSPDDVLQIAKALPKESTFVLQQFIPDHALHVPFRSSRSPSEDELKNLAERCSAFVKTEYRVYL